MSDYPELWNEKNFKNLSPNELRYQRTYRENFSVDDFKTKNKLENFQTNFIIFLFISFVLMIVYSLIS